MFESVDEPNLLFQTHRPEDHPDNHLADGVQSAMLAMMNKLRMVRILLSIHILIVEHSIITHIFHPKILSFALSLVFKEIDLRADI